MWNKIISVMVVLLGLAAFDGPAFAAWTTPRTWVAEELVTATMMNTHIRDNENLLHDALSGAQDFGANFQFSTARDLRWSDAANVAHGMTTIVATDVYARINILSSTAGGMNLNGFSDTDAIGFNISGVSGSTAPTTPVNTIRAFKKSGTGVASIATTEIALAFQNGTTTYSEFYGNGMLEWHDAAVAHGMTTALPTDVYGQIYINDSSLGGFRVRGTSEGDIGLFLIGFAGTANPSTGVILMDSYKKSGTSVGALSTSIGGVYTSTGEPALEVRNGGSRMFRVYGDGGIEANGQSAIHQYGSAGYLNIIGSEGSVGSPTVWSGANGTAYAQLDFGTYNSGDAAFPAGATIAALKREAFATAGRHGTDLSFRTAASDGSGGTPLERMFISADGDVRVGSSLTTGATNGFLRIPTCAGTPTGVPAGGTGSMVYDTTNNKLYIYNGGWKGATHT
jgi:hypothetical protein